jgi:acetyl-CoA acyltransferase
MGTKISINPSIFAQEENLSIAFGMGLTGEIVAKRWKVSREDQDTFALASHQKACAAVAAGHFRHEITPYTIVSHLPDGKQAAIRCVKRVAEQDEGPRPDSHAQALARLKPVFAVNGTVTAGNSSQMSDGAAALVLASERALREFHLQPLARFVSFAVAGVPPEVMGIGPVMAIPKVLTRAGLNQQNLDWIELNEAFAAQSIAVIRELDLDPSKVNPLGGAIALGHPLGATGAIRSATLVHGLRRTGGKYGLVTMCIGTGMGAAGLFEAL